MLQSKCLRLVTGSPRYLSNRQIHTDLAVPLLADRIRALTENFDSKLADAGNPLFRQLGRLSGLWPLAEVWPLRPKCKPTTTGSSRPVEATVSQWPSRPNESCSALVTRQIFGCPDHGSTVIFLGCKENSRA